MLSLQLFGLVSGGTFGCSSCSRCCWLELGFEAAGGLRFAVALSVGGAVWFECVYFVYQLLNESTLLV